MTTPTVAVIGAGAIAPFHIAALRRAGFTVSHMAASDNSTRARKLAAELKVDQVWANAEDLVATGDWDAILLASSTESLLDLAKLAIEVGKPCLVEKPVAFHANEFRQLKGHDQILRVAYNRRFYTSSLAARSFAAEGPCIFHLELPDTIGTIEEQMNGMRPVREHSVHGLDLLAYVIGRYEIREVLTTSNPRGRLALAASSGGHVGVIKLNWNCPANFSLVLDRSPRRFEMRPFELGSLYEGVDVLEPNEEIPVRRYVPKLVQQVSSFPGPDGVKPGFLEQALSLMRFVTTGQWDPRAATIADAAFAADIARTLTN